LHKLRWLLVVLVALAVPIWVVATSKTFQACIQTHHDQPAEQHLKKGMGNLLSSGGGVYRECLGEFIENNGEGILASFTIMLALSTIFLWIATRDLVREAKGTSERELRAYLGVENVSLKLLQVGEKPEITIVVRNFGQTPAYRVTKFSDSKVGAIDLKDFPEEGGRSQTALNPGETLKTISTRDTVLTQAEYDGIKDDTIRYHFFGIVRFIDAFGKKRFVRYRFHTYGERLFAAGQMAVAEGGNKTSEE
jgi:hypothetical protein